MKDKALTIFVLLTGIALSGVAAFYSIIGLTTLFSGAYWSVVVMGGTLEIAKLVSVSWLYHNWNRTPVPVKLYLSSAILILMLITSMGIYGYLSKAYIDQKVKLDTGIVTELPIVMLDITAKQREIDDIDKRIKLIDDSIAKLVDSNKSETALRLSGQQQQNRSALVESKDRETKALQERQRRKIEIENEVKKLEAELGPIKYVAEALYGVSDNQLLDKAVRFVIIILIIVFDPLAIFLLIAFNISMRAKDEDQMQMEYLDIPERLREPRKGNRKR